MIGERPTKLDPGTLCIASAWGDHRYPLARNLYVILGEATDPPHAYRCRPIWRNGGHHGDKTLKHKELTPISAFAVRVKSLDRDKRLLVLEPDPSLPHTAAYADGAPRVWHGEAWGLGWRTNVDPEALDYITAPPMAPPPAPVRKRSAKRKATHAKELQGKADGR